MTFAFYPKHEYHCPHVGRCPHVGGAALGTLVACANQNEAEQDARQRVLEGERATKTQLLARVAALEAELAQTKAELRLERRGKFRPAEAAESGESAAAVPTPEREPKKRGAPVGHPGWFRPRPPKADRTVTVAAPSACPHCGGAVRVYDRLPVEEHFQEDLSGGQCQTTCFQHPQARCVVCRRWVQRGCEFHRQRRKGLLTNRQSAAEKRWLREELERLEQCLLDHPKAATLQARLRTYHDDWLVFLDHPEVPPTNNLAEQALRPLVILRKLTYGSRSRAGAQRLADLLTVMETAKRRGHDVLLFLYKLQLRSPGRLLRYLYDTR